MDIEALKNEITNDPLTRGYSSMTDAAVAVDMETPYRSAGGDSITGTELLESTVASEYDSLTASQKALYVAMIGMSSIDIANANVRAFLTGMFTGGTATRTNLVALATKNITRSAELGIGFVRSGTVAMARGL